MAGYKNPKSICGFTNPQNVEDGTMARMGTMQPGSAGLYEFAGMAEPAVEWDWAEAQAKWTAAADWPDGLGAGPNVLRSYKDSWVRGHREAIKNIATLYELPAELLGGIAWIETGGRGDVQAYDTQNWGESDILDDLDFSGFKGEAELDLAHMQEPFQRALEYLGADNFDDHQMQLLFNSLQLYSEGLSAVAKTLSSLKDIDYPGDALIGPEEMRVIAARFYRGAHWSLDEIQSDFSLGDLLVDDLLPRVKSLLQDHI